MTIGAVEVLQAAFELAGLGDRAVLPAGLTATNPLLVSFLAIRALDSPFGPFALAQARLSCRSGVRARALVVAGVVDADDGTAARLAAGWGVGDESGGVAIERRYDRLRAEVPSWDLALEVERTAPISTADLHYVVGLHPVVTMDGEARLAQVELDVAVERAERGRPVVRSYAGLSLDGAAPVQPAHPVAATLALGSLTLPRVRFLLRLDVPPEFGTEFL